MESRIRNEIPLARAIDLRVRAWDGNTLAMAAPLAPNINDKGCAFGGSLASVMTLAGWALVTLALGDRHLDCDVFVGRSEVFYRAPVWRDFLAYATLTEDARWDTFFDTFARRGKTRIGVRCHITEAGHDTVCATLAADFVAKQRDPDHAAPARDAAQ
ncbi:MAG TPA: YiiD C-terminal domain-containing protein [Rhodanobacteraceae bacterium]